MDSLLNLLPGMVAGIVGVIVGYPLETLKTQMQMNPTVSKLTLFGQFRSSVRYNSYLSLYSGVTPTLISQGFRRSYQFWIYETLKGEHNCYLAGAVSGLVGCPISSPFHLIRTRLQLGKYPSPSECVKTIYRSEGIRGFFHGTTLHTAREVIYSSVYLGNYYHLQQWFRDISSRPDGVPKIHNHLTYNFLAGSISALTTWGIFFPLSTLEIAIQSGSGLSIIQHKVRTHGFLNLWKGFTPVALRIVPVSGLSMMSYETVKNSIPCPSD
jgi:solute carrier family 25 (mitochondrial carnitine/acylcarnitine transporter), member 20/29